MIRKRKKNNELNGTKTCTEKNFNSTQPPPTPPKLRTIYVNYASLDTQPNKQRNRKRNTSSPKNQEKKRKQKKETKTTYCTTSWKHKIAYFVTNISDKRSFPFFPIANKTVSEKSHNTPHKKKYL